MKTAAKKRKAELRARSAAVSELIENSRGACLDFLNAELRIANTLLDIASTTSSRAHRARLRDQAARACQVVAKHVITDSSRVVSDGDRAQLTVELGRVHERLSFSI